MRLFRIDNGFVIEYDNTFYHSQENISWDDLINRDDLYHHLKDLVAQGNLPESKSLDDHKILAPLVNQEVWAAGVTYYSSRLARMEESKDSGGGDFYSRVYVAERPEIFLKPLHQERLAQIKNFEFVKIHHGMFLNPSLLFA